MSACSCLFLFGFFSFFFFFNDTATTEIYTLSLHDALPICSFPQVDAVDRYGCALCPPHPLAGGSAGRSEEHTSELQSRPHLVCRLLLEKKKINHNHEIVIHTLHVYAKPSLLTLFPTLSLPH